MKTAPAAAASLALSATPPGPGRTGLPPVARPPSMAWRLPNAPQPEPAPPPPRRQGPLVSVVIKALNEERNIEATLRSVLEATRGLDAEVVLADSASTDRTVQLASAFPVRVVQLAKPQERCCGIGPQLGFQHARGEFIYLMDGDMRLCPDFLERALSFMQRHTEVAGVGGRVVELNMDSLEYRARNEKPAAHQRPGAVDRLDGGGLYRRRAIESVGHFSNRNLHSYEEFELAMRLRLAGWVLWRLADDAVTHRGHETPPYELLARRWRSGYICGLGELLRASLAHPRQRRLLLGLREMRLYLAVLAGWLMLLVLALLPWSPWGKALALPLLAALPLAAMAWRKRSWARGAYALASWNLHAAGLLRGLLRTPQPPQAPIESRVLHDGGKPPAGSGGEAGGTEASPLQLHEPPGAPAGGKAAAGASTGPGTAEAPGAAPGGGAASPLRSQLA